MIPFLCRNHWTKRSFHADPQSMTLTYTNDNGSINKSMPLKGLTVTMVDMGRPQCFRIDSVGDDGKQHYIILSAAYKAERKRWVEGLGRFSRSDAIQAAKRKVQEYETSCANQVPHSACSLQMTMAQVHSHGSSCLMLVLHTQSQSISQAPWRIP